MADIHTQDMFEHDSKVRALHARLRLNEKTIEFIEYSIQKYHKYQNKEFDSKPLLDYFEDSLSKCKERATHLQSKINQHQAVS